MRILSKFHKEINIHTSSSVFGGFEAGLQVLVHKLRHIETVDLRGARTQLQYLREREERLSTES